MPAIWNMAGCGGRTSAAFGLWATYPAEPVNGLMVSDRLFRFLFKEAAPPAGVVPPREREAGPRDVQRRKPRSITRAQGFMPWLTAGGYEGAPRPITLRDPVGALRRILIETVSIQPGASWIGRTRRTSRLFTFRAPTASANVRSVRAAAAAVVTTKTTRATARCRGVLAAVDDLIGVPRAGGAAGSRPDARLRPRLSWSDDRPRQYRASRGDRSAWHRKNGIYLLWGPASRRGRRAEARYGSQVAPTLMALAGLPPGTGIDVAPLPGAPATSRPAVDYAARYVRPKPAAGSAATRTVERTHSQDCARSATSAPRKHRRRRLDATRSAGSYNNEGLVLRARARRRRPQGLRERADCRSNLASAMWNLSDLLFEVTRSGSVGCAPVRAFGQDCRRAGNLIGRAIGYQRAGNMDRSLKLLENTLRLRPEEAEVWLFSGRYRVREGRLCRESVSDIEKATRMITRSGGLQRARPGPVVCRESRCSPERAAPFARTGYRSRPAVRDYVKKLEGR